MSELGLEIVRCEENISNLRFEVDHPTKEVMIRFNLVGGNALKLEALMNIASILGVSSQEMLKDIFERGINKEFEYWKSKGVRVHANDRK